MSDETAWYMGNVALILCLGLFAIWQINSHLFTVVPRVVKYLWISAIVLSMLILFETAINLHFITFYLEQWTGYRIITIRTNMMAIWLSLFMIIAVLFGNKAEKKRERVIIENYQRAMQKIIESSAKSARTH